MPHITVELSDNFLDELDPSALLADLNQSLSETGDFPLAAVKSRLQKYQNFFVADGRPENVFIHVELAILAGRDLEQKQSSCDALADILKRYFPKTLEEKSVSMTIEVRDIDPESYQKVSVIS